MSEQREMDCGATTFRTVLLDPPWPENGGGKCKRGADKHYKTLKVREILPVILAANVLHTTADAHMYLWATNNYLQDGLQLMAALGFKYKTNLCWAKDRAGIGQYFRGQHELCLFGVRGKGYVVRSARRDISTLIEGKRGAHSAKPPAFYQKVEARSLGPYLEMFARGAKIPGWETWGDEAL